MSNSAVPSDSPPDTTWDQRSKQWAARAPETVSENDAPNQLLIQLANIQPGDHVLDIASGTGEPAISIALHVGDTGYVTGSDATAGMLEAARARAERLGLKNIEFELCAMEDIKLPQNNFDAVTCRFGLMHAEDALSGLKNARRVLKPGKLAACLVHGPAENNTLYSTVRATLFEYLGKDDPDFGRRRFRFSKQGELTDLFTRAGFTRIEEREEVSVEKRALDDEFWENSLQQGFGPITKNMDDAQMAELRQLMKPAFAAHLKGDHYELTSSVRSVCGQA